MRIAVLEDDPSQLAHLVQSLSRHLVLPGEAVTAMPFEKGEALRRALRVDTFDMLILDWGVPDLDGLDLLRWLRTYQKDNVPVIMLTSRGADRDVAEALDIGADDYLVKPFRIVELSARVRRLLARRRIAAVPSAGGLSSHLERFGHWVFDRSALSVRIERPADAAAASADPPVPAPAPAPGTTQQTFVLTDSEFRLVLALFRHMGKAVSRTHLLEACGRRGDDMSSRALDSHVYRLRVKLGLHSGNGVRLQTVYGQGYRLELSPETAAT